MPAPADLLKDIPFFTLLDDQERAVLAARLDEVRIPAGKVIFQVGSPGGTLYVMLQGEVELYFVDPTGERVVVEVVHEGEFFGDLSLLDGGPRTTSAVVTQDLVAIAVEREDIEAFLKLQPAAALDLLAATGRRLRETVKLLRQAASRNVNVETEDHRSKTEKAVDWISNFSGSLPFLYIHCLLFAVWIGLNVGGLADTRVGGFDPFPFGLLTMAVSLEAIILSVFVLLSQNRQADRDRVRNEVEYKVNLKAELEIAQMHVKVDELRDDLLERLERLERGVRGGSAERR
jgi:uncharacterized membrane protein